MEEKERYEWNSRFDEAIKDNQTGDIVNAVEVLNKQDKRIKELVEENKKLIKALNGEVFINYKLPMENAQLKQQLEEKEKTIQSYEKIVEQKDEEISFANRDKIYIVKQLNDPKDYVLIEDYKKVEHQLKDKEQENERLKKEICKYEITLMDKN